MVTVTGKDTGVLASEIELGQPLTVTAAVRGVTGQLKFTVPVNPAIGVTVTLYTAAPPGATVCEVGVADTEKSGTGTRLTMAVPQGFEGAGVITLHALTVTVCAAGIDGGAVYSPAEVIVPTLGTVVHVTPVLLAPSVVEENCWVAPGVRFTAPGLTVTENGVSVI